MSITDGFMIPLDFNDWKNYGDRTSWCSTQPWWTNQNISLQGSSLGPTEVKLGETVKVAVGIQGVAGTGGATVSVTVRDVQAWACYPSPTAGSTSQSLLLPSMTTSNPAFTGSVLIEGVNPALFPGSYQNTSAPFPYALFPLLGPWTPTSADLMPPNTEVHCCLIATSAGANLEGTSLGTMVPSDSDLASLIDICTSPYQGQCNISIISLPLHKFPGGLLVQEFGFLVAGLNVAPAEVGVDVSPVEQANGIDPAVLRSLKGGPYAGLDLKPATSGLKGYSLAKNPYKLTEPLSKIVRPAEKMTESGTSLRLSLPSGGIQPLLLRVEVDAASKLGSVYAFDIVQTDAGGKRGGIRVGAVVVQ